MPKVTTPDTDLLRAVNAAVQQLARDCDQTVTIPSSLLLLSDLFPQATTLFLEIHPAAELDWPVQFGQFLKITAGNQPEQLVLPDHWLSRQYSDNMLREWFEGLLKSSPFVSHSLAVMMDKSDPSHLLFSMGNIAELYDSMSEGSRRDIMAKIGDTFQSYVIFPLCVEEHTRGFLLFLSPELTPPWQEEEMLAISTYTASLANLLARHEAERLLRIERDQLRQAIDMIPNMIFVKNKDDRFRLANKALSEHLGVPIEGIEGQLLSELPIPQDRIARLRRYEEELFQSGRTRKFAPTSVETANGQQLWIQTILTPVFNEEQGQIEDIVGISMDITQLQEAQMELKKEQHIREMIASTIPDNIFLVDLEHNEVIYRNVDHFLGYPLEGEKLSMRFFIELLHPDKQLATVQEFLRRLYKAKDGEVIETIYHVENNAGEYVWISERVKVFQRAANGWVKQYLSVVQDITEKQETLRRVSESEQRYRNFIEYSIEGIYFMNCGIPIPVDLPVDEQAELYYDNAYIEECNRSMAQMYGLQEQSELVGQTIRKLHTGPDFEYNRRSFIAFAKNGHRIEDIETKELDANGNLRYFVNRAVGVIENGHLVGIWGVQQDITSKRQTEKALAESELKLSSVIADTKVGIWEWYLSRGLVVINQNCLDMIGLPDGRIQITEEQFWTYIHPDDRSVLQHAVREHLSAKTDYYQVDVRLRNEQSGWLWTQIQGRRVESTESGSPTRVSGTIINIHEKKIADLLLKEGETLLKATLNTLPDIKIRIDHQGKVLSVYSPVQERTTFQMLPEEMVGKNLTDCLPVYVAQGILHNAEIARGLEEVQDFEFVYAQATGNKHFEARINAINEKEAMVVLRNISALKMAEKDLNEKLRELDIKNRQLQAYIESNLQLENFAYIASHDLREPVRTMRTFAQILKRHLKDQLNEDAQSYLEFIINGANQMNELIEDLLLYSRVNTDPMEKESIDLTELLAEVTEGLATTIEDVSAKITMHRLPKEIYGSRVRIRQLFQNLLANAVKFSTDEEPPVIQVRCEDRKTHWQFSVKDNGIGIREEFFEQIFKLFKKLHARTEYQGTGIGLALCEKIVQQHNGEIWLESTVGKGTTFYFTLEK